ncbi:MAG TPA: ABC transporter permease [Burkholderiaceae bacterium]
MSGEALLAQEAQVTRGAAFKAAMPRFAYLVSLPLLNLLAAFICSALVIVAIGEDPAQALSVLVNGAFGTPDAIAYTLYKSTNYVFAGLAVAVAFHAGLFNIGVEGQAYFAGLGVALVCLYFGDLHWLLVMPMAIAAALLFGAAWAFLPGWLQAKRGSHIVVTTIMFNFIASALMNYILVKILIEPGQQVPQTREFAQSTWLPFMHEVGAKFGMTIPDSPLNVSFFLALLVAVLFYLYVWRTKRGYTLRVVGINERAARYAGVSVTRTLIVAMCISGALAGLVAVNEVQGVNHKLLAGFTGGVGFVGIAVALMGRNHPVGILLAALLFGALAQGGTELSLEMPTLTRDMIVVIEGLIIFFCGAMENLFRAPLARLFKISE